MSESSSDDEGEESIMLYFDVLPNDRIKIVKWPRRGPSKPSRLVLIPRDVDFFNHSIGRDPVYTLNLLPAFRGHTIADVHTIVRLKQGKLTLKDISRYESYDR